jgi:hypothetical protein
MPRLDGKVAVVTGAAAGPKAALGAIFAKALAAEGAKVVLPTPKIALQSPPRSQPKAEPRTPFWPMCAMQNRSAP